MQGLTKEAFKYIEREMYDYEKNKKTVSEFEYDITSLGATNYNNEIRGTDIGRPTESKAIKLCTNKTLLRMRNTLEAIDRAINRLDPELQKLYKLRYRDQIYYVKIYTCDLPMAERTYYYKRDAIVQAVAEEMGLI